MDQMWSCSESELETPFPSTSSSNQNAASHTLPALLHPAPSCKLLMSNFLC